MDPKSSVYAIEQFYSIMAGGSLGPYDRKPGLSCSHFGERSNTLYLSAYMDVLLMTEYRTVAAEACRFSPLFPLPPLNISIRSVLFKLFLPQRNTRGPRLISTPPKLLIEVQPAVTPWPRASATFLTESAHHATTTGQETMEAQERTIGGIGGIQGATGAAHRTVRIFAGQSRFLYEFNARRKRETCATQLKDCP